MGRGRVGFASVARIYLEGLKEEKGGGERFDGVDSEVRHFHEEGRGEEESGVEIFVFVPVEVHDFLAACSDRSLEVQTMGIKGCSEVHSGVERPVREIPRWTVPRTRQRLVSPVGCSLPYIACWSIWVVRLYEGGHIIPLVGEIGCGNPPDGRSCQGTLAVGGRFDSLSLGCCRIFPVLKCL